jgi:hypothetical protein
MTPRTTRLGWLVAVALAACTAVVVMFKQRSPIDQEQYEPLIAQLRAQGMRPGETREFWWEPEAGPKSVRPYDSAGRPTRGKGAGHIWVRVLDTGGLQVVVQTRDMGHAGEYGVAYLDDPLLPSPSGNGWYTLDVPGHLNIVQPPMQMSAHWWQVLHNLD